MAVYTTQMFSRILQFILAFVFISCTKTKEPNVNSIEPTTVETKTEQTEEYKAFEKLNAQIANMPKDRPSTPESVKLDKIQELIKEGIEKIEVEIELLNTHAYKLNYEINKINNSIKNNFTFDIEKVKKVFEETEIYFPDKLVSDYEGLIKFNKDLTNERNKLLKSTLKVKKQELEELNTKLLTLNNDRSELMKQITDKDTFIKFKKHQKDFERDYYWPLSPHLHLNF